MSPRKPMPARYPPTSVWPAVMRADMVAAYLDYRDTSELSRAVVRREAPPPTGYHGAGRAREPVWARQSLDSFVAPAPSLDQEDSATADLVSLV